MPSIIEPLTIPDDQEDVPGCIKEARKRISILTAQLDAARQHIKTIQRICEHPKDQQEGGRDISGVYSTLCKVCGLDR